MKLHHVVAPCTLLAILAAAPAASQTQSPGQLTFERNCGTCHGGDGLGGEMGPNLAFRLTRLTDEQLSDMLQNGKPNLGMPAFPNLRSEEKTALITFLHPIHPLRRLRFREPFNLPMEQSSLVW